MYAGMVCKLCSEDEKLKGLFVTDPCSVYKLDKIKVHEQTKYHRNAIENQIQATVMHKQVTKSLDALTQGTLALACLDCLTQ